MKKQYNSPQIEFLEMEESLLTMSKTNEEQSDKPSYAPDYSVQYDEEEDW